MQELFKFFLILVLLLNCTEVYAFSVDLSESDKQQHVIATALISGGTYLAFRENKVSRLTSGVSALLITMSFAFLKERFVDEDYNVQDMQANLIGASAGVILPLVFTF